MINVHIIQEEASRDYQQLPTVALLPKSKSVENRLLKTYNWLKYSDLIPNDIKRLRNSHLTVQLRKISEFHAKVSNVSISFFNIIS